MTYMPSLAKALLRDERGTSVVELAFVAPLIMMATLAAVQFAEGFAAKLKLEQAAGRSLEKAIAFNNPTADSGLILAEASVASGQPAGNITVTKWLECNGVVQGSYTGVCPNNQQIGRYVSVRITKLYQPSFNYLPMAQFFGGGTSNGNLVIKGQSFVRVQ